MCLITFVPAGGKPCWETLEEGALRNPDGFGLAWYADGKARSMRSLDWSRVRSQAKRLLGYGMPFALHQRLTTHGLSNTGNCHPFRLRRHGIVMMHNGVIPQHRLPVRIEPGRSDTWAVAAWADGLRPGFLRMVRARTRLELIAGSGKFVFLDAEGTFHIINEEGGHWRGGCWYSNGRSFPDRPRRNGSSASAGALFDQYAARRGAKLARAGGGKRKGKRKGGAVGRGAGGAPGWLPRPDDRDEVFVWIGDSLAQRRRQRLLGAVKRRAREAGGEARASYCTPGGTTMRYRFPDETSAKIFAKDVQRLLESAEDSSAEYATTQIR